MLWHKKMQKSYTKVVMLGNSGAGKSSLLHSMLKLKNEPEMTIGCTFRSKEIETNYGAAVLHLWDTCGQERFRSLTKTYLRGCKIIVMVIDPAKDIGTQIDAWIPNEHNVSNEKNAICGSHERANEAVSICNSLRVALDKPTVFLVVNKIDLLSPGKINILAEKFKQQRVFFTSAKANEGTQSLYDSIALEAVEKAEISINDLVKLENEDKPKSFCCA